MVARRTIIIYAQDSSSRSARELRLAGFVLAKLKLLGAFVVVVVFGVVVAIGAIVVDVVAIAAVTVALGAY